jgi:N-acylglucosamine 2-epimerase
VQSLRDHCLEQILYVFAKDDRQALFESVARDGSLVDDDEGRVLNPGHSLESMWFCIEEGRRRGDRSVIQRAVRIIDWMYRLGYDRQHGGLVSFLDASDQEPKQMDWHRETNVSWHDKVWWVHSEALYALALAAVEADNAEYFARFLDLHRFCQEYFYDAQYGER